MGRRRVEISAHALAEVEALAAKARSADAHAADQWAAVHDAIARQIAAGQLTAAAAADKLKVSEATLNRALAARRAARASNP